VAAKEDAAAAGSGVRERGSGEERGCFNVSWQCRVKQNLSFVISPSSTISVGSACKASGICSTSVIHHCSLCQVAGRK
jgi:hypothetical protein